MCVDWERERDNVVSDADMNIKKSICIYYLE